MWTLLSHHMMCSRQMAQKHIHKRHGKRTVFVESSKKLPTKDVASEPPAHFRQGGTQKTAHAQDAKNSTCINFGREKSVFQQVWMLKVLRARHDTKPARLERKHLVRFRLVKSTGLHSSDFQSAASVF